MENSKNTFETTMLLFKQKYKLLTVFDDFLTMACCSFSRNPATGLSYDEALYLETIKRYSTDPLRFLFPKLIKQLINEANSRKNSRNGNDILGDFYQKYLLPPSSKPFIPWGTCLVTAQIVTIGQGTSKGSKNMVDAFCESGRMLLAFADILGPAHYYYGIERNSTLAKIAAINLFLNGIFNGEILCLDAKDPRVFTVCYQTSLLPFGIHRVTNPKKSYIWNILYS